MKIPKTFKDFLKKHSSASVYSTIQSAYHKMRTLYLIMIFRGKKYYCPCCENWVRKFFRFEINSFYNAAFFPEGDTIVNVECPICGSFGRHRIICGYLKQEGILQKDLQKNEVILFAPEKSIMMWLKKKGFKFTTADLYADGVDLVLDLQNIGLPDRSVSFVICNHVLEHVPDASKAISELYRILKTDGRCILSVPLLDSYPTTYEDPSIASGKERAEHFGQFDHLRIFGMDFGEILEKHGFTVEVIDWKNSDPCIRANFNGPAIYDSTKIFVCKK